MTLRDLLAAHPTLFAPQTWYLGEDFLDRPAPRARLYPRISTRPLPTTTDRLVPAVALLQRYVEDPHDFVWRRYLWTGDVDAEGQRVYVGVNNGRMEIHRHLHLTARFGVCAWT